MAEYLTTDTDLESVADAIRAKGGTIAPLEYPDGFVSAIQAIPTGGGSVSVPEKEVNFYDYDGTCVYSYTPSEFAALTELPANPSHEGLTAQGWNWSLSDAKTYVADYGRLNVGQMYITDDGKTRIYIHLEQGRTSPVLGVCPNGTVDVDWGDGTAHDTLTGSAVNVVKWTPTHNYAAPGDYVIKLTVTGSMGFYGSSSTNQYSGLLRHASNADARNYAYLCCIKEINIGNGITYFNEYIFYFLNNLRAITIPVSITAIYKEALRNCRSLTSITLPSGMNSISPSIFSNCYMLSKVAIPKNIGAISNDAFNSCYSIYSISIPNNVTSIGSKAFWFLFSLSNVHIPSSVTAIAANAFQYCYSIAEIHFKSSTPPTISNSNAFSDIPADCKIYVPTGSLSAYTSATNYPSSAIYTYIEE